MSSEKTNGAEQEHRQMLDLYNGQEKYSFLVLSYVILSCTPTKM